MTVSLIARCHPALEPILPKPVPARDVRPDWLREMPGEVEAASLGGIEIRTLKHCPPLIDALGLGLLMPLACDLVVTDGEIAWDWDLPPLPDQLTARAPVAMHAPEQATGSPLAPAGAGDCRFIVKFVNFWTLEAPPGWSVLFTHPFARPPTPFHTLSGVVDCDSYHDGYVHFPAIWTDPGFSGVIPAGTPVAQAIPLPREALALTVEAMDAHRQSATRAVQEELQTDRGAYRKTYRS